MLKFDDEINALLERAYHGVDSTKRRLDNLRMLDVGAGERIIDLGCGPGFMTRDLSGLVGEGGTVYAVDPSPDMLAKATARCAGRDNVKLLAGNANAIPVGDDHVDGIVSVQVFEYVSDIPSALVEARRVLKPGGRIVIGDIHFDSVVWHSADRARMRRVLEAWDAHLVDPGVPERLPAQLRDAGFVIESMHPHVIFTPRLRGDSLIGALMHVIAGFVAERGGIDKAEAQAWLDEQRQLAREDRFFFSANHFITRARVPDA